MLYIKSAAEFIGGFFKWKYSREDVKTSKAKREQEFTKRIVASETVGPRRTGISSNEIEVQPDRQNHKPY